MASAMGYLGHLRCRRLLCPITLPCRILPTPHATSLRHPRLARLHTGLRHMGLLHRMGRLMDQLVINVIQIDPLVDGHPSRHRNPLLHERRSYPRPQLNNEDTMNNNIKDLIPSTSTINKVTPLAIGSALAFFFGFSWLILPLILAFFFPSFFKIFYTVFLFIILGTSFTGLIFLFSVCNDWLPFAMSSWWIIARCLYVPIGILSLYLSADVNSFSQD